MFSFRNYYFIRTPGEKNLTIPSSLTSWFPLHTQKREGTIIYLMYKAWILSGGKREWCWKDSRLRICLWAFQTSQWNLTIGTRPSGFQISRIPQSIVNERCLGKVLEIHNFLVLPGNFKGFHWFSLEKSNLYVKISKKKCYSSLLLHIQAVCPTSANWEFGSHIYSVS